MNRGDPEGCRRRVNDDVEELWRRSDLNGSVELAVIVVGEGYVVVVLDELNAGSRKID